MDRPVALVRVLGVGRGPSAGLGARGRHDRNRDPRPARSTHDDREGGLARAFRGGDATRLRAVPPRVARDLLKGVWRNQRVSQPAPATYAKYDLFRDTLLCFGFGSGWYC